MAPAHGRALSRKRPRVRPGKVGSFLSSVASLDKTDLTPVASARFGGRCRTTAGNRNRHEHRKHFHMTGHSGLVGTLLSLPIFQAEWVLWLLIVLSMASVAIMIERSFFFTRHKVDSEKIRLELERLLSGGNFAASADYLKKFDSL